MPGLEWNVAIFASLFCFRSLWASLLPSGLWHTCIPTHLGYGVEPDVARSQKNKITLDKTLAQGERGDDAMGRENVWERGKDGRGLCDRNPSLETTRSR